MAIAGTGVQLGAIDGIAGAMLTSKDRDAPGRLRLQEPTADLFRGHVGTLFQLRTADGVRVPLTLKQVTERQVSRGFAQFSLIFHAPGFRPVPDGTYTFQHRVLGEFDVFVVPVGAGSAHRTSYQACFSRRLNARERNTHNDAHVDRVHAQSLRRT